MTFDKRRALGLVVAVGLLQAGQGPAAAETGTFALATSLTSQYARITHMDGTLFSGASEGTSTIVRSSGGPFVEGRSMQTSCIVSGKTSAAGTELDGACTSASPSGDMLFSVAKRRVAGAAEEGGEGDLRLLGGAGSFEGITGSCSYDTDYLTETVYVTWAECTWQR